MPRAEAAPPLPAGEQDVLLSRHAAKAGDGDGRAVLLKASHDGDGHCFGSHENYEATVATGIGLWVWRLTLIPALLVLFFLLVLADVAALYLVVLVSAPVYLAHGILGHAPGRIYALTVAWIVTLCRAPVQLLGGAFLSLTTFRRLRRPLLPFLVTRTILSGAGMVRPDGRFVLCPRPGCVRSAG